MLASARPLPTLALSTTILAATLAPAGAAQDAAEPGAAVARQAPSTWSRFRGPNSATDTQLVTPIPSSTPKNHCASLSLAPSSFA